MCEHSSLALKLVLRGETHLTSTHLANLSLLLQLVQLGGAFGVVLFFLSCMYNPASMYTTLMFPSCILTGKDFLAIHVVTSKGYSFRLFASSFALPQDTALTPRLAAVIPPPVPFVLISTVGSTVLPQGGPSFQ
jgi:hypothetical protein